MKCPVVLFALILLCCSCAGGGQKPEAPDNYDPGNPATFSVKGTPQLENGLGMGLVPDQEQLPRPKGSAQAGRDFASNRFIVIFEDSPQQLVLAQYLGGGTAADAVRNTDNAPLVQHPYLRAVSHNLAQQYGLTLMTRVFWREVNFAVYELAGVDDIGQLDTMMRRVWSENRGLVREVCYDYFIQPVGFLEADAPPAAQPRGLTAADLQQLFLGQGGNYKALQANQSRSASAAPDDPMHLNKSGTGGGTWANWRVGAVDGQAWDKSIGGTDVLVAVIDTGIRMTHEDLAANVITPASTPPFNAPGVLTDVQARDNDPSDGHGHGTVVTGCLAAVGNNSKGLAGMCQVARVLPIKIFNDSAGGATDAIVAEAILLADYLGVNIVNMSIGGPFPDRTTQLAADQAAADGVLLIAAAGNWNTSGASYPGFFNNVFCIGATTLINASGNQDFNANGDLTGLTRYDGRAGFSNYGAWVDIAAPGVETRTCNRSSDTAYTSATAGTSIASPYAAGCAALLWSYILEQGGTPDAQLVRGLLQSSATEMTVLHNGANPKGFLNNSSNGTTRFINVKNAMDLYDAGGAALPEISWDNPADGETVSGTIELAVSVTATESTILKVEYETLTRLLGTVATPTDGLYELEWDTGFEFNSPLEVTAKAYDDEGNIAVSTITVTPSNTHVAPAWSEDFAGLADNTLPSEWFTLEGNQGTTNTAWGATNATGGNAVPSLKSTGSSATYAAYSVDWLFAPILDLTSQANSQLTFKEKHTMPGTGSNPDCWLIATPDDYTYYFLDQFANGTVSSFTDKSYDLSFFAGKEVRVFWAFNYSGGGGTGGVWIDDVAVSGHSGTPPSITIDAPDPGASVSGIVAIDVTVSDDTDELWLEAAPPVLGKLSYSPIADDDPGPNKTYTIAWDSRASYNAGALLTVYALVDADDDGTFDLVTPASVAVSVNNPTRDPQHFDGYEDITDLGGQSAGAFDGDWFTWGNTGAAYWRIGTADPWQGTQYAQMGAASGNYEASEVEQLYSPVTDLSTTTHPYLRLWHKLDVEAGGGDYAKILLVRYNGLIDTEVPVADFRSDVGSWTELSFDLSAFAADPLRFNFLFVSDSDANYGTGWQLDNFELLDADPQISSMTPGRAVAGSTTDIAVAGARFGTVQGSSSMLFAKAGGGTTAGSVQSWSDTSITVRVPADAVSGDAVVQVLGHNSSGHDFRVILDPPTLGGLDQR